MNCNILKEAEALSYDDNEQWARLNLIADEETRKELKYILIKKNIEAENTMNYE